MFAVLLSLLSTSAASAGNTPSNYRASEVRVLAKIKPSLAKQIESALPLSGMLLLPGQSGNADVETFVSRHSVSRLVPLYPGIVKIKKQSGLTDLQIATSTREVFAKRGARLHATFQPPEISRTYLLEFDAALREHLPEILTNLKADPNVEFAEEDKIVTTNLTPNDPYFSSSGTWGQAYDDLWGIKKIGAPAGWDISTGAGILVAVVDTGVDYNHPDIAANMWPQIGADFVGSTIQNPQQGTDPIDRFGHGTHVAGTIAAVGNNGIGVIGVAWHAQVMAVKGLDDSGQGLDSTLAPAILYAANNGADIINASWGGPGSSQAIADAVSYAYNLGVVFVAAAGNSGADAMGFYPANLPNVITVAATDSNDQLAGFSNYGSKIDIAAPGVDILSLQAAGSTLGVAVSPGYMRLSGTSMATPHVSGLAALILAQYASYSNEDIRQVLRVSATDLGTSGYDLTYGYGRINAASALGVSDALEAKITSPVDGIVTRGVLTISGVARGTGFSHYVLEYGAGALPSTWTTIQTSSAAANGTLGLFDTSSLADGIYDVRLTVFNASNQAFVDQIQVVVHSVFILTPVPPPSPIASTTFKNGAVISITGTAICGSFINFKVDWATGINPDSGWQSTGMTLAAAGSSPVSSGLLANWDTSSIIAAGYYTIRLTCNSSQLAPQQTATMVYLEPDLLSYNWPQFLFQGPGLGAGVVPAHNADGTLRLLLEAPRGPSAGVSLLWTLDLDGTLQQTQQPGAGGFMQPSVANFEGGTAEQAMVIDFSDLDFFHEDGSLSILNTNPNVWYVGSQTVVEDLAGDSTWETVGYGIDYNNQLAYVSAWRPDGTQLNSNFPIQLTFNNPTDGSLNRNPVLIGDLNGNGKKEIVVMEDLSPSTFTLRLFASDGSPLTWQVPVLPGILSAMAGADLDNNGMLETIVAANTDAQTSLHVFQPDGTERVGWPLTFVNSGTSAQNYLAVGDFNRDRSKEIVYAHAGFLYLLKGDGTSFSSAWPLNAGTGVGSAFGYNALTIGDVDGDGFPELVTVLNTLASGEQLLAIRRDGTISRSWQLNGNGCYTQFYPAPTIGDFNQDGITDIAVAFDVSGGSSCAQAAAGVVTILSTGAPYNPAVNDWPLVRHDARNTSVLQRPASTSPSTTALLSSLNPSIAGQSVIFTATVATMTVGASAPTGDVSFVDSSKIFGSCTLLAGTCTFTSSALAAGTHTINAQYLGDTHSEVSTSAALSQVVNAADFSLSASSAQPVNAGSSAIYTITVAPNPSPYNFAVGNFVCGPLPAGVSCSFSANSVSPGAASATTTLTVTTTSRTVAMASPPGTAGRALFAACLGFTWIGVLGIVAVPLRLNRTKRGLFTATLVLMAVCAVGCGGGNGGGIQPPPTSPTGTPAGTYNIVVTATGNAGVSHSASGTLKVN